MHIIKSSHWPNAGKIYMRLLDFTHQPKQHLLTAWWSLSTGKMTSQCSKYDFAHCHHFVVCINCSYRSTTRLFNSWSLQTTQPNLGWWWVWIQTGDWTGAIRTICSWTCSTVEITVDFMRDPQHCYPLPHCANVSAVETSRFLGSTTHIHSIIKKA